MFNVGDIVTNKNHDNVYRKIIKIDCENILYDCVNEFGKKIKFHGRTGGWGMRGIND